MRCSAKSELIDFLLRLLLGGAAALALWGVAALVIFRVFWMLT